MIISNAISLSVTKCSGRLHPFSPACQKRRRYNSLFFFPLGLEAYQDCNIDKRPASAFVMKASASAAMVMKIQNILKMANFADLQAGGIVSSYEEKLVPREASAKEYVGSYGDHYNALTTGPPANKPTTIPTPSATSTAASTANSTATPATSPTTTSAASSVFFSFTLPIVAIFAFLQLA